MLRISELTPRNHSVTLRFEGRLVGPWVLEASQVCERLLGETSALKLDLTDLSFLDRAGAMLLLNLRTQGVRLLNGSPFVEEQLKAVTSG
jgi:ABC-type transporter Mla MlaB component